MPDDDRARASTSRHGAEQLPSVTVDTYNAELRDADGFLGDRASKRAFIALLDDWRDRLRRLGTDPLGKTPTRQIIKLASAFTSGLTPSFTLEKITIGRVLAPGPDTKLEITRSSSDSVKLNSQLEASAGAMMGKVVSTNARTGPEPRSIAASSSERSALCRRDCTVTVT